MANAFKLNKTIVAQVEKLTAQGVPIEVMAPALGASFHSIYSWKKRGERLKKKGLKPKSEHDALCVELFEARKRGEMSLIESNLKMIRVASLKSWQAAAWILERRYPQYFGKIERTIDDESQNKNKVALSKLEELSNEELQQKYDAYKLQNFS